MPNNADPETISWLRFALASTTVIGLMALLAYGLRFVSMRGWLRPRSAQGRMELVSTLPLDARRRLVIAKCDQTEYILLLGAQNDLLLASQPAPPPSDQGEPTA